LDLQENKNLNSKELREEVECDFGNTVAGSPQL